VEQMQYLGTVAGRTVSKKPNFQELDKRFLRKRTNSLWELSTMELGPNVLEARIAKCFERSKNVR